MREPSGPEPRFEYLFAALVLLVLVYPYVESLFPELRINLLLRLAVLAGAVRAMAHHRRGRWLLGLLAAAPLPGAAFPEFGPGWLPAASLVCELLFYGVMIALLRREVYQRPLVTRETLFGAASMYLMIGLVFGAAYQLLALDSAASFRLPAWAAGAPAERTFTHFSFATLTTLGFGDITPLSEAARSLVVLESLSGVLFASIVISRLIALHVSSTPEMPFERPPWWSTARDAKPRFEALLAVLILQIALYPHVPMAATRLAGIGILLAALYSLRGSGRRLGPGLALGVPATLGWGWWSAGSIGLLVGHFFLTLFLVYVATLFGTWIFRQREVGREAIAGVCCVYVLIGAAFASAFGLLFALDPNSLSGSAGSSPGDLFASHVYLSFVTLTTLGYGDILPLSGTAQSLTMLESVIGVLFPAVVVAELVSLYRAGPAEDPGRD